MTRLTDEILVAYVDDELPPEKAAEVEQVLMSDQQAREAVQVFRDTADWSRRAFDDVLHEPVPERLIKAASGVATPGGDGPAPRRVARSRTERPRFAAMAMAASIALAIGVGGGIGLSRLVEPVGGDSSGVLLVGALDNAGELHRALESTASGTLTETGNGGNIMPLTTFVDHRGRYCREFQSVLARADAPSAAFGIACRRQAGSWHIVAVGAAPEPGQSPGDQFVTADGAEGPLQVLVGAMAKNGHITMEDESALLARGWK